MTQLKSKREKKNIICSIFGHKFSMTKEEIEQLTIDVTVRYIVALHWALANNRVSKSYVKEETNEKLKSLDNVLKKLSKRKIKSVCKRCNTKQSKKLK